jgi:hypothetical protein
MASRRVVLGAVCREEIWPSTGASGYIGNHCQQDAA